MKKLFWILFVAIYILGSLEIHAQDVKNESEMQKIFAKFTLQKNDFEESIEKLQESCSTPSPWQTYEFIGKPEVSTKDDKICFRQEIFLTDGTRIFAHYMILATPEDAMKAVNCFFSDTAWVAHVLYVGTKEELGLEKFASAFYYDEHHVYALAFQCENLLIDISIHAEDKSKEKNAEMCHHLAKTIITRIKSSKILPTQPE